MWKGGGAEQTPGHKKQRVPSQKTETFRVAEFTLSLFMTYSKWEQSQSLELFLEHHANSGHKYGRFHRNT